MTLDLEFSLGNIITLIFGLITIVGLYWKMRLEIKDKQSQIERRPNYDKVEEMIKEHGMTRDKTENLIEKIVLRDAYPKASGKVLEQRLNSMDEKLDRILDLVDKKK